MVYVVERYLPGLSRSQLLPGLSKLEPAIAQLRGEGSVVRYLGSTIVLGDEACFCQFEGPSEAAVAEANRRAGLPFDRIVPALLVDSHHRRGDMSVSISERTVRTARSHRLIVLSALVAAIAVAAWAIATYAVGPAGRTGQHGAPTNASALSVLTRQERQYVLGLGSLTAAQFRAAFGTAQPGNEHSGMESLTRKERRYVRGSRR